MLFKCFRCGFLSFGYHCQKCETMEAPHDCMPIDPQYLRELMPLMQAIMPRPETYETYIESLSDRNQMEIDTIFLRGAERERKQIEWEARRERKQIEWEAGRERKQIEWEVDRKREQREWEARRTAILQKYKQFERPYFVNFVYYVGREAANSLQSEEDTSLVLFKEVLVRLGFEQLNERPGLTRKLVLTTMFRMDYSDFVAQTAHHISGGLESTLRSWIEERGAFFRSGLPMLLYYLWEQGLHTNEIRICTVVPPLIDPEELKRIYDLCERIYFDIEVSRLQLTLEHFDPSAVLTMFTLDAMKGYEFEEFLGSLLTTIGYDVQVTKRSGDQGADLFAERFGKKIVIQAKNYNDTVGNAAVQQVLAAKLFYGCDEAMVITNSYFTASAKELGESTGVRLVDRTQLQVYLDEYNQTMAQGYKASSLSQED